MKVARKSPNYNRHAAGIYTRGGKLILATANRYDEHAEYRCIMRYLSVDKFRRNKIDYMIVIRLTKSGNALAYSKPCTKCQTIINDFNIKIVHS